MIWKLAFQELRRNLGFDALIFLLLILVYSVIVGMGAVVEYRFQDYLIFARELQCEGQVRGVRGGTTTEGIPIKRKEEIMSHLEQTTDVEGMYCIFPMRWQHRDIVGYSYDAPLLEKYEPKLEEGVWLTAVEPEDQVLKAVVSYNDLNIGVGDTLTVTNSVHEDKSITVEIIGLLAEDAEIIGYGYYLSNEGSCSDFLVEPWDLYYAAAQANQSVSINMEESDFHLPVLFFANEQLNHHPYFDPSAEGADGRGYQRQMDGLVFILYEDGISEGTIEQNYQELLGLFSPFQMDLQEFNTLALNYILSGMKSFIAVIICVFCLILVASVSIEMLTAKKQLRNYAIYYITGLQWKHTYRIHLLHMLYLSGGALLLTGIGFGLAGGEFIHWNVLSVGICIFMLVLNLFLSVLAPKILIGRTQPVTLFHEN